MTIELNTDPVTVEEVRKALRENDGYCPCKLDHIEDNKCLCKDFREDVSVGEFCGCGLYKKITEV